MIRTPFLPHARKSQYQRQWRVIVLLLLWSPWAETSADRCRAWAAEVELLTPKPGATIIARNPETHLVLRQSGPGEAKRVRVERSGAVLAPVISMQNGKHKYLHFRLPLEGGMNSFTILPGDQRLELKLQPVESELDLKPRSQKAFFFHEDENLPKSCQPCHELRQAKIIQPIGMQQQISCNSCHQNLIRKDKWQHSTVVNQQCLACHQQSAEPWRIGLPTTKIENLCFNCHAGKRVWNSRDSVIHGPMAMGGCTLCHSPHGGDHRFQLWAEGSLGLCLSCHADKENLVSKEDRVPYVHGIITGKGCVACHDPHASSEQFMLHLPVNELCVGCHPKLVETGLGHPVAGHPLSGPREIRRRDRKLTCVGCHEPHGTAHQYLLIETKLGARLCRECHKR
jgi:predicted CXXCH cytochrome family protein